jgi:hypothetical protein
MPGPPWTPASVTPGSPAGAWLYTAQLSPAQQAALNATGPAAGCGPASCVAQLCVAQSGGGGPPAVLPVLALIDTAREAAMGLGRTWEVGPLPRGGVTIHVRMRMQAQPRGRHSQAHGGT